MNRSEAGKLGYVAGKPKLDIIFQGRKNAYLENPTICLKCGTAFSYKKRKNKFCNQKCGASYNNRLHPRKMCKDCKVAHRYKTGCIFCEKCHRLRQIEWENPRLGKGSFKKLLVRDRGWQCESCKNTTWQYKIIPLEMHHVDGNSDNWDKDNLQLLCPNCHAFTPNYKSRNLGAEGSRQLRRRKRYREGKTY